MEADFPLNRLLKIAFITSLFFGLFGSTPGFAMEAFNIARVAKVFVLVSCFTFIFWLINIFLARAGTQKNLLQNNLLRFAVSTTLCSLLVFITFHFIQPPRWKKLEMPQVVQQQDISLPEIISTQQPGETPIGLHPNHNHKMMLLPITQGFSINIIIFILIELTLLRKTKNRVDRENEQLKLANLEAKNNQLKQQLQPHFLFNSLSTLRSLISRSPEKATDYLDQLAELLRFSTNNSRQAFVLLQEELELCINYLNMQKVRFGDALNITVTVPELLQKNGKVPVYALQQLAENAIKHNAFTRETPLQLTITASENTYWIEVKNNVQPKQALEASSGLGLANLSERYRLVGNDDIVINHTTGSFSVSIKILNYAGSNN